MLALGWLTGGLGICIGYHRLFTHRSFVAVRPLRWLIAVAGSLAGRDRSSTGLPITASTTR